MVGLDFLIMARLERRIHPGVNRRTGESLANSACPVNFIRTKSVALLSCRLIMAAMAGLDR
jgi:hypothetical protein